MRDIASAVCLIHLNKQNDRGDAKPATSVRESIDDAMKTLHEEMARAEMPAPFLTKVERIREFLSADQITLIAAEIYLKELSNDVFDQLTTPAFLMISEDMKAFYLQPVPPFGTHVSERFPDAREDIASATRCIALDEWTAAVFHLMRVAEHGLRVLAREVAIPMSASVEYEQWRNVIDQIHRAIRAEEQMPRTPERQERMQIDAEAAVNLGHFKNAWRNHVSHARSKYDQRDALNIWSHVRAFMDALTTGLPV